MTLMSYLKRKATLFSLFAGSAVAPLSLSGAGEGETPSQEISLSASESDVAARRADLIQKYIRQAEVFEGKTLYPYLDSAGNLTIGYGFNIQSQGAFDCVRWTGDKKATQIRLELLRIRKTLMDKETSYKKVKTKTGQVKKVFNLTAEAQKTYFKEYRISAAEAKRLFSARVAQDELALRNALKKQGVDLYRLPEAAGLALMDMQYNLGTTRFNLRQKWPSLLSALKARDFSKAAAECKRGGISEHRNAWTTKQMNLAGLCDVMQKSGLSYTTMPEPAKDVLRVMYTRLGTHKMTEEKWPMLFKALKQRDYAAASREVHIKGVPEATNVWMQERMRDAAAVQPKVLVSERAYQFSSEHSR